MTTSRDAMRPNLRPFVGSRLAGVVVLLAGMFFAINDWPVARAVPMAPGSEPPLLRLVSKFETLTPIRPRPAPAGPIPVFQVTIEGLKKDSSVYSSRYRVTNLSTFDANTSHNFLNTNMVSVAIINDNLVAGQSKIYDLANIGAIPNGFSGHVVVSADQPITGTVLPSLVLTGPDTAALGVEREYTADVHPLSLTLPVTYEWSATGQSNVQHIRGLTDTVTLLWSTLGPQVVTLTVTTAEGEDTKTLNLTTYVNIFLPDIER